MSEPRPVLKSESVLMRSEERKKRMSGDMAPVKIDGTFTVETYSKFSPGDLTVEDRAYVHTDSGNVYRLERSRSRPGLIKIQNERSGGEWEYAAPMPGKSSIFEVGQQMHYATLNDPDDPAKGGTATQSSSVSKIEIWRNYSKAIRGIEKELQDRMPTSGGIGTVLAAGLTNVVAGAVEHRDYRKRARSA